MHFVSSCISITLLLVTWSHYKGLMCEYVCVHSVLECQECVSQAFLRQCVCVRWWFGWNTMHGLRSLSGHAFRFLWILTTHFFVSWVYYSVSQGNYCVSVCLCSIGFRVPGMCALGISLKCECVFFWDPYDRLARELSLLLCEPRILLCVSVCLCSVVLECQECISDISWSEWVCVCVCVSQHLFDCQIMVWRKHYVWSEITLGSCISFPLDSHHTLFRELSLLQCEPRILLCVSVCLCSIGFL
jgi:hypothetical protein